MINLKYKKKYLKYKYKYLELKTQLGGVNLNSELTKCLNNNENEYYDAIENRCCKDAEFNNCGLPLPHIIDHSQIPSESSLTKDVYEFDKNIEYTGHYPAITWNNIDFKIKKDGQIYNLYVFRIFTTISGLKYEIGIEIARGANGIVMQYYDSKNNKYIAVKYGFIMNDIKVIKKMEKKQSCSTLVVGCIIHGFVHEGIIHYCIIMENAIGTIEKLIPIIKSKPNILVDILYAVAIAIKCLQNIGLYYTDIKYENIFFRNTDSGIQIILGDLGSAGKLTDFQPTISFIPYEWKQYLNWLKVRNGEGFYPYENKKEKFKCIIAWGFGILICDLLGLYNDPINSNFDEYYLKMINSANIVYNDYINEYVTNTLIKNNVVGYYNNIILKTLVSLNYRNRLDINGIINELNIIRKQYLSEQLLFKQLLSKKPSFKKLSSKQFLSKQALNNKCKCKN